jgi:hypothetical protein
MEATVKKLFSIILIAVLWCGVSFAGQLEIKCGSVASGEILASGSTNGTTLQLRNINGYTGFFSIQPVFTGSGVLKIEYQLSNDGDTWGPAVQIVASATSGTVYPYPESGVNIFSGYQRLIFTETGASNPITLTGAYRCVQ